MAARVRAGDRITERDVQERILLAMKTRGLTADGPPIVAVNANSANPHYSPPTTGAKEIRTGDLVLIDMWARQAHAPRAIYADMTWVFYVGAEVPRRYADVFAVVVRARDAAVALIKERAAARRPVRGWEADRVARDLIVKAGYGEQFIHRTGHSIDTRVHGDGANLDDFETRDVRALLHGTGFSVEPGIYIPGDFGVRSEIDCYLGASGLEITTPVQTEIVPILRTELATRPAAAPARAPASPRGR
jgi:Xaa-Pro aminopeptidase